MQHAPGDDFKQPGVGGGIRQLSTHNVIILSWLTGLVLLVQHNQEVGMGQAPLLELHHTYVTHNTPKDVVIFDFMLQRLQLLVKDTHNEVMSVIGGHARLQLLANLRPFWVACHGDEQIRLPLRTHNGHGVLIQLGHVPWAPNER
jgi:hypothetical protein